MRRLLRLVPFVLLIASPSVIDPSPSSARPLTDTPVWVVEGDALGGNFGVSVATAGDVNGDGVSDLIVGAWKGGVAEEGRAYVYLGSAMGVAGVPAWIVSGGVAGAHLGFSVAAAGDVNGDGYGDVVVGAPGLDQGFADEGCALLFLGSRNGLAASPAWRVRGRQVGIRFGVCVAGAGDVDGDGFDDVIVGADGYDATAIDAGRAFLYRGGASGTGEPPAWFSDGDRTGAAHGACVAGAGDVNGDGYADILVGAPGSSMAPSLAGKASLFLGGPEGPSASPSWTSQGSQAGCAFGSSVSAAGDLNGDGYADIVIGAPGVDGVGADAGAAYAYLGSASGPAIVASWMASGDVGGARLGTCVSTAGDVDGDGFADLIVGAPFERSGGIATGAGFLYLGSPAGPGASSAWSALGGLDPSEFGHSVGSAGDLNGDGFGDVVIGAWKLPGGRGEEGGAFAFTGNAGPAASAPSWTMDGLFDGDFLGFSTAAAGDIDGDGYGDLLVSSPFYPIPDWGAGRVWLYRGSASGLASTPSWEQTGPVGYAYFGYSMSSAGDVNGDGYGDVVIGSYYADGSGRGRVYLYAGSPAGLPSAATWTVTGPQQYDEFGYSVAAAGDVNGDGYGDVIVGARTWGHPDIHQGAAFLYLGSASGLNPIAAWSAYGGQADAEMGWSVAGAGDVNGDGFSDLIVGADRYDHGTGTDAGAAFVYLGGPSGPRTTPDWTFFGETGGSLLGNTVASAGDLNADGYSEIVVTAPDFGYAYVFDGSAAGPSLTPSWAADIRRTQMGWTFSTNAAAAGDVNNDGYGDLLIGDPWIPSGGGRGQAYLFLGSPNGPGDSPYWVGSASSQGLFGHCVASAGDINGDGFSDVAIGDPWADQYPPGKGRAYLFLGNGGDGLPRTPCTWNVGGTAPIALRGTSDNPYSFRLKALGRTAAGRDRVTLEFEVKPLGVPFDGSLIHGGVTVQTAAPVDGVGSVVPLDDLVPPDLSPGVGYRWRARIAADAPCFPRTPWFSPQGNSPGETDLRTRAETAADAIDTGGPDRPLLLSPPWPNPFADRVRIDYALRDAGAVRVSVHDPSGRRVALLVDGRRSAGTHRIDWDGRNGGMLVASGTYVVRVEAEGRVVSEKITLSR